MAFESRKGLGDVWNPTKDAEGNPRDTATPQDYLDGWYVDIKENVGQYSQNVYTIETETGERMEVWGVTALNSQMATVPAGAFVRLQWHGLKLKKASESKSAKQLRSTDYYHDWEVFVDKDKSKSVAKPSVQSTPVAKTDGPKSMADVKKSVQVEEDDSSDLPF
jgi:hypothetical protein